MRQVPYRPHYLIVGAGRLARHLQEYFNCLGLSHICWNRKLETPFSVTENVTHILLAISDSALAPFIAEHATRAPHLTWVHFSGANVVEGAIGAHPLMAFSHHLYDLETYKKIPFVLETPHTLAHALPGLENKSFQIRADQKALYHALCVMSGNFTTLLWQKCFSTFERDLNISREAMMPYMTQIFHNLETNADRALTGPLARKDFTTIEKNLASLEGDPFQQVYKAFVNAHKEKPLYDHS